MAGPFDYSLGNVPDPSQAFTAGLQQGNAILQLSQQRQQQQLAMQAEQQNMQQQQARFQALQGLYSNPNPTVNDYVKVGTLMPDQAEHLTKLAGALSGEQKRGHLAEAGQVAAALRQGRPDVAKDMLSRRIELMGESDPRGAAVRKAMLSSIEADPKIALDSILLGALQYGEDGKRLVDSVTALAGEDRAAAKAPLELRKLTADAAGAESDATKKAVDAEFARPLATAELQAKAAALGLTKAQTNQAIALTKKYGQETQKVVLEMQNGNPEKRMEAEAKLRKEYTEGTKGFTDVTDAYRRVKSSQNNAVGDLSLIYGYMKMLDPGSVVREGEFATAQNATGVPQRIANIYNKVASGERLSEEQRKSFISQAGDLHETARKREAEVRGGLERVADAYKLSKPNIFGTQVVEPTAPKPPPTPSPAPATPRNVVVQW